MVQKAEQYPAEDEVARKKIEANNWLKSYAYNLQSTIRNEKIGVNFPADGKENP